ncbi:hypothetical protein [uncultured Methanobrevibacter sp.]|uniref:hypothetical protein n=1 Tax=uncultured Methanobrevibacter sp. TaxID=253161 RepID=UPI0025CFE138|nr:hypothetical protein [uncultured Methanobrevibacter sp.]
MLMIFSLILTVNVAFAENETAIQDVYVSVEGSDSLGNGSVDNPYHTLDYTIGVASNNSNIYLKSGVYNSTGYEIVNKSISITGIGDVTVDGGNGNKSQLIFKVNNDSSLILNNIKFINGYADLEGSLSPIINEGNLKISNCNFYNFTTINGAILNKNSLTLDNISESKLSIDWKSVFGEAGNIGFISWIQRQIKNNPSRGEFVTNIGDCVIFNSKFVSTVYNNRNMNVSNSYLSAFISNRSYDMDIRSVIDKSQVMSLRVSNNDLLVVNNSFVDPREDELWNSNAIIQNSTFFNDSEKTQYSFRAFYSNVTIKSSSFNRILWFDYSNVSITYSTVLDRIFAMVDSNVDANYNWWGDNRGPRVEKNAYAKVSAKYWIVMAFDCTDNNVSVDFVKYTDGNNVFDLKDICDVNQRLVKLETESGSFKQSQGYLVNGSYRTELIGNNLNTMIYAKVDNQVLRFAVGDGYTDYTWYVSNDKGNDYFCDGSPENPFKTLSKAVSMAYSGNTIYVMEGVYTLSWNANLQISKELYFVGLGNAVLSRPNARNIFIVDDKGILNIDNINFTTFNQAYADALIYLNGGQVNVKNSNFYDIPANFGIIYANKSDSIYLNNVSFNNFVGCAIKGNSKFICVNNTYFTNEASKYHVEDIISVNSDIDVLNSRFENNTNGLISTGINSLSKTYIYNTSFVNNNWINRNRFGLNIDNSENNRRYAVIDSCYFYKNRGHIVVCNVINNSCFINNTDVPFEEYYVSSDSYLQTLITAFDLINNSYFYGNQLPAKTYTQHVIQSDNVYNSIFIKNTGAFGVLSEPNEVHYCVFLNNTGLYGPSDIFVYKGNLNASSNWWGSNQKPDDSKVQVFIGNLTLENWVILNITQEGNKIIASLDNVVDDDKNIYRLNHTLPERMAYFTSDNGEITPVVNLVNNYAIAHLIKNTTSDFDVYVVVDNQKLSLTVYNNSTLILIDDVTLYGKNNKYKITLINVNGHKISNQLLDVVVKSKNGFMQPYTLTTDENGVSYLNVDYAVGMYNIEVIYYGNGYFEKSSSQAVINVSSIETSIYSHDFVYWGKNNRFYMILTDELGRKLLNQSIVLEIYNSKNKLLASVNVMTGTNGQAETLFSLDTGDYIAKWNYLGDDWYKPSYSYSHVTVNPINTTLTLPNATLYGRGNDYEFTFTDIYGNRISDETINLKISNATDSADFKIKVENGVGSININLLPGIYDVEASFAGDNVYGSANVKSSLNIQKVYLTLNFKSHAKIPENGVFTVILKDMYGKRVSSEKLTLELYEDGLYKTYNETSDANGEVNFKIDAVENIYFAIMNYDGSTWYNPSTGAATVEVSHSVSVGKVYLDGTDYTAYYGENGYFTILFNDTNKFSLEGMSIPVVISSGDFSKAINAESDAFGNVRVQITLEPGTYNITYKYENPFYNIYNSKSNTITIFRMPTSLVASDMIIKKGDNKNFEVKLINKNGVAISNLPVAIKVDGKSYNVSTNSFGIAKLPLNLDLGYHSVECEFENVNYISSSTNTTILVVDDSKTITGLETNEVHAGEGKTFNYRVLLLDALENPIKSSQIVLNITDVENNLIGSYETYTNQNGEAIFYLNLSYGTYTAKAYYSGNNMYFESFNTNNIYISPFENVTETILFGSDAEIINGYGNAYYVILKTVDGDFIENATVEFIVKGNKYYSTTDNRGKAVLNALFNPGAFEVKAKFEESSNLTKAYVTNHIRVSGEPVYLVSQDVVKSYHNGTHYYVALFDALGRPMVGKTIHFIFNNETYNETTDGDGFAVFEVWFGPGEYNITAFYQGSYPDEYRIVSNNIAVLTTLLSSNVTVYYTGKTTMYATFFDFSNNALNDTDVLLNINGVTYKVKTDEYGIATLPIKLNAGSYDLNILNTVTGQIEMYNVKILSTISSSNLVKYYKGSANFKAIFKDKNGKLLKNTLVKFTLKSKTYSIKTNANGVATLKINLKPGKYTITTRNTKTGEKHSNKITVKTRIITSNKNVKVAKKINFQAKILKSNGEIAKKATVKFNINKKTYNVKTDSKGIAKVNIKLNKGKYTIKTTYAGLTVKNTVKVVK